MIDKFSEFIEYIKGVSRRPGVKLAFFSCSFLHNGTLAEFGDARIERLNEIKKGDYDKTDLYPLIKSLQCEADKGGAKLVKFSCTFDKDGYMIIKSKFEVIYYYPNRNFKLLVENTDFLERV